MRNKQSEYELKRRVLVQDGYSDMIKTDDSLSLSRFPGDKPVFWSFFLLLFDEQLITYCISIFGMFSRYLSFCLLYTSDAADEERLV